MARPYGNACLASSETAVWQGLLATMGPYGKQLVYHLQGGEEDQGEGAGEAWGFGRFPCTSGRIGGVLEVTDNYTRPRGDGQEVSRRWTATECDCGPWTDGCGSRLHLARGQPQAVG